MQPAMLAALHRGAFATSSPSHRVRPSARASARGATITRAAGGFRVIEYGDGTTPESRGESRRRDDGFDDRGEYDRARPRGGRGGRGGRAFGGRGRGPPRRDRYDDEEEEDDWNERRDRGGRGSLRQKGRGGRGIDAQRGFGGDRDGGNWGERVRRDDRGYDGRFEEPRRYDRAPPRRDYDRGGYSFPDDASSPRAPGYGRERGSYGGGRERGSYGGGRERGSYGDGRERGSYGMTALPDSDFVTIQSMGQEGRVIGKGGAMVNELQQRFGCRVNVRRDLGVIEVSGGDVAAAEDEIRGIVDRGVQSDLQRDTGGGRPPLSRELDRSRGARDGGYAPPPDSDAADDDDGFWNDDDDDDDWVLEGLEDELDDAAQWSQGKGAKGRYVPTQMSKYVDDDFEPMVYTREPDDEDEYNFFSGARFAQLGASDGVTEALKEMGIERPSHIQSLSYRALTEEDSNDHVLLADQAGSGKTLAYLLPLLQRLAETERTEGRAKPTRPRMLVLVPTSELAVQVLGVIRTLSRGGLRCRSLAVTGGEKNSRTQIETIREGCDVVVGTPGRIGWLVQQKKLDPSDLQAVVMDECDVLLGDSFEFAEQVAPLRDAVPNATRFVLVTATIPEDVLKQLRAFFDGALRVVQGPGLHRPAAGLLERLVDCSGGDVVDDQSGFWRKFSALEQLLDAEKEKGTDGRSNRMLLFCNKIETCRKIENLLIRADKDGKDLVPLPYHAALTPDRRKSSLEEFLKPHKRGDTPKMLVCTDRASRGLDAAGVTHVVLFDFPRDPSEYVRRVGRTARGALGKGEVSVLVLGRQVRLAREIMRRNTRGDPVESTPQY